MRTLYTVLFYLIQPLVWLRLLYRSIKAPAYRHRWPERYGFCQNKVKQGGILVHSVSVGETLASQALVKALQTRYPHYPITVTTMTPTGSERVKVSYGDTVSHVYLPYDLPGSLKRFINTVRPKLVIIIETELWPNFIALLHQRQIPLIVANARLSDRSTRGYLRFVKSVKKMLQQIPLVAAQNKHSGDNFLQLGLPHKQLEIMGSIKFDITLSSALQHQAQQLKTIWAPNRLVWIAASTYQDEEKIILSTYKQLLHNHPDLLLILVPRHADRFKEVDKQLAAQHFNYILRSTQQTPTQNTQIILIDTMGELLLFYGVADIAFVGGSLIERGGHNPLEAALHQLPIVMGKYVFNFAVICPQLEQAQGLITVDEKTLYPQIERLLNDPLLRQTMGHNAETVLKQNQGALQRLLNAITRFLPE